MNYLHIQNGDTRIDVENVEIMNIFDVNFKYCVLSKSKKIQKNTLYVDKTKENQLILKGVKSIKIGDIQEKVKRYSDSGTYIEIELEKNAKDFEYPNFFEVIK